MTQPIGSEHRGWSPTMLPCTGW